MKIRLTYGTIGALVLFGISTLTLTLISHFYLIEPVTPPLFTLDTDPPSLETAEYSDIVSYWSDTIRHIGGVDAYQHFKTVYGTAPDDEKHQLSHIFGRSLYTTEGFESLGVCDEDFSYGCYHEFIGLALSDQGLSVLEQIDDHCREEDDCQHGIGHGLVAHAGYDYSGLEAALALCQQLGTVDPLDGCFGGIFMEYNNRTMLSLDGVPLRNLDSTDPAALCRTIPTYATSACYFWLPTWWIEAGQGSVTTRFTRAANYCLETPVSYQLTCFNGLASEVVSFTRDHAVILQLCKDADPGHIYFPVQCQSSAAASLSLFAETRLSAKEMCQGLLPEEYKYCQKGIADSKGGKRIQPYNFLE